MKEIQLDEVFEFVRNGASIKQADGKGGYPISRIETIWNKTIDTKRLGYADIGDDKLNDYKKYLMKEGDILMTHINSPKHLGKCAVYNGDPKILIHGMNLLCMRANQQITIPTYIKYFFNSKFFKAQLPKISNQSVNQASFSAGNLKKLQIPLPPLDQQKKIAAILDAADAYRQKTKALIEKYDELTQSLFLDMFGDPVTNPKGWEIYSGEELCEKISVGVVIKPASHYREKGVIALRSLNIKPYKIDLNEIVYFSHEAHEGVLKKSILMEDDVVIVRTGNTGTAAIIPKELDGVNCIDLIIVRVQKEKFSPVYLCYFLNSERGKQLVSGKSVGGIQKHFNVGAMKKTLVPLPSIDIQTQFAERVQAIEEQKAQAEASLAQAEDLFNSLLQRAFKGELTS